MAVSVCKMLAGFMKKPLYTISSLKLMASGAKGKVISYIDARRGNVFRTIIDTTSDTYIVNEAQTELTHLKNNSYDFEVNDSSYKVDPLYVIKHKRLVSEPHLLVPNYLRVTEAERNLNDKAI
jgi:tRNA A37 threonylcarbamoyladenosine modification protein TsaB